MTAGGLELLAQIVQQPSAGGIQILDGGEVDPRFREVLLTGGDVQRLDLAVEPCEFLHGPTSRRGAEFCSAGAGEPADAFAAALGINYNL